MRRVLQIAVISDDITSVQGRAAFAYIERAITLALAGEIDGTA